MFTIPNFQIIQPLYDSENSSVYRAIRSLDQQPVILKWLKADFPSVTQLARYQHEYELLRQLTLPGVIQAYSLEKSRDHLILVLEDFGGDSLNLWLTRRAFTVIDWLPLAIQMADSLGQLHAAQVIHKDINPNNIVWNPATGTLKLIDFGIATRLPRETLALQNPNQLEGTLPYLSPEQTGRMNRALDYRTDLYSLGVTFYELFTGRLPFETQDAMELVHCHLAKQPLSPHQSNAKVPLVISHLILRLLAKPAEERYQSAWGVKADLEQILANLTDLQDLSGFELGQHDFSDHFHLPQQLYGREEEVRQLLAAFENVTTGQSQLLLVAGYSGIGKTALVQEIYKPITERRGYFIAGKFDQFQRNVPYSAVVQAFRDLVRQLLTETQAQLDDWKAQILTAVGANGQVIMEVIAEVELILGPQPAVPALPPTESQNRFNLVFQNFIKVFCQADHPLVMFLDDLQWVDSASLKLMTLMMNDIPYLLLIGAYRDNEVSPAHALITTLEEMQKQGILVQGILVQSLTLTPLTLLHLNQLVSDTLHLPLTHTLPLAELVMTKTGGNPFFVGEFLKTLYVEQLLRFNSSKHEWQWDLTQIKARNITDNVVELMTGKILRLKSPVQQVLTLAATTGNQFDLATLSVVSQQSSERVKTQLWEALVEGLVVPLGEKYKFVHDRVQQAAYSLIPEGERAALHWQIGQLLKTNLGETLGERLFEVVDHLNQGSSLATTPEERMPLVRLNLQASQKAKAATAYRVAAAYLHHGRKWLTPAHWQTDYDLTLTYHLELVEVMYLCGDLDQMETVAEIVLQQAQTPLDKVNIYEVRIRAYTGQRQFLKALQTVQVALSLLGLTLPEKPTPADIAAALANTASRWQGLPISELVHLPPMTLTKWLTTLRLLSISMPVSYLAMPELFPLIVSNMVNLSIDYGNSELSPFAYACYGVILCGAMAIEAGYQFGQLARQLLERLQTQVYRARTFVVVDTFVNPWKEPLLLPCRHLTEVYHLAIEEGNLEFAGYASLEHCAYAYFSGQPVSELEHRFAFYLQELTSLKQDNCVKYVTIYQQSIFSLLREVTPPVPITNLAEESKKLLEVLQQANDYYGLFIFYVNRLALCYLFHEPIPALENATLAKNYLAGAAGHPAVAFFHFYESLSYLAIYLDTSAARREEILQHVSVNQEKMQQWAQHAPMNYQHKYDLVAAEKARGLEQKWEAAEHYEKAITGAKDHEYLQEEALAYELAGRFYLAQGMEKFAHTHLTEAYSRYQRWGAIAKLKHLERQYPHWLPPHRVTAAPTPVTATLAATVLSTTRVGATRLASSTDWLDLTSVLKAAQALSGEIVLENLLTKMMRTVIENAGAQRGVLILEDHGQWVIQAEATVQPEAVTVLQASPLTGLVPTTLLNYVIRTKQSLVFAELQKEAKYRGDDYMRTHALKSVLCLTLLHQQQLVGVIYLENNLTAGAFTPDRFQVLTLLSSQMAISLDNARFVRELQQARQLAEEARQAEAQARQAAEATNYAKTAFLANVGHELRTPLNGILGYTQLLQQDPQLTVVQRDSVRVIHQSGEHLLVLVSDILDITKLQTGRLELQLTDVYLSQLLTELADWFHDQAQEKGLTFRYEPSPHLPTGIVADGKRLRQVLLQLLSNAVKFTQHGGITFQVQSTPLSDPTGWHHCQFIVIDTGIGMTATNLSKLFTPFEQVSDWLHKSAGAGLGLSLAKQLVELMGGQIQVHSSLGQGSIFTVQVDFAESKEWQPVSTSARISDPSETPPRPLAQTLEESTSPLKGPPADQAAELYDLSQMGDFMGILHLVDQLEQEDAELGPFVAKVRQWAKNFQDTPIEELARRFMVA